MMLIPCPWCGPRNAQEFGYLDELTTRPNPTTTSPEEWRAYLHLRTNPCDWVVEQWHHRAGCQRFFVVERHTLTNEVRHSRPPARQGEATAGGSDPAGDATGKGER